jgi:hypothetical protein
MNEKKIPCQDINNYLAKFLLKELPSEEERLFLQHIQDCPTCNAATKGDIEVHKLLESFYNNQVKISVPSFNWDSFYKKMESKQIPKQSPTFNWLPKFALATVGLCFILALVFIYFPHKTNHKKDATTALLQKYARGELAEKKVQTQEETPSEKFTQTSPQALEDGVSMQHQLKSKGKIQTLGKTASEKATATLEKDEIPKNKTSIARFSSPSADSLMSKITSKTSHTLEFKNVDVNSLKKNAIPILPADEPLLDIIKIDTPSSLCSNNFETIEEALQKYKEKISYKVLFYIPDIIDKKSFKDAQAIVAAQEQNSGLKMCKNLASLKNFNYSRNGYIKELIKLAKKINIPDLKKFAKKMRKDSYKKQIKRHFYFIEQLNITPPALLFIKEDSIISYPSSLPDQHFLQFLEDLLHTPK